MLSPLTGGPMTREEMWLFYQSLVEQQHRFMTLQQDRSVFNWGLVSAIVTVTVLALTKASWSEPATFWGLCVMSGLLATISHHAVIATTSADRRFFETGAIRAMIEQDLGMTDPPSNHVQANRFFWKSEPLVTQRLLTTRGTRSLQRRMLTDSCTILRGTRTPAYSDSFGH